ncbi:spindle assembly abnormal 4 [Musca autumnalis]|uniref:spindle assembly abnormal 4 n=1 Tax=Musca autumnalis TaxID=221902 RepID=UPI003CEC114F
MLQNDTNDSDMSTSIPMLSVGGGGGIIQKADIVKRLEQLSKWQEEQKQLLALRQNMQRQMLGMEQKTMYQMLGLQSDDELSEMEESRRQDNGNHLEDGDESLNESTNERDYNTATTQHSVEPSSYKTLTSGYGTEEYMEVPVPAVQKPKRPFLKRGDGLKQRFKIDPEELRINNLPRYKYANAHPKLKAKPKKLPKVLQKPKGQESITQKPPSPLALDANEKRFQQLLISSKNVCNSTPDTKSSLMSSKNMSSSSSMTNSSSNSLPKVRFVETTPPVMANNGNGNVHKYPNDDTGGMVRKPPPSALAWSKILDSQQIKPLPILRPNHQSQNLPQSEEDIFELLEQKAKNGSFDMDSTCMRQFMQRHVNEKFNDTDVIPVNEQLRNKRLQPIVGHENNNESVSSLEEENHEEDSTIVPNTTEAEEGESAQKSLESTSSPFVTPVTRGTENRVRFSESHDTREFHEEESVSDFSNYNNNETEQSGGGDLSNNMFFEQFKKALFAALQDKADQHETLNSVEEETTLTSKDSFIEQSTSIPPPLPLSAGSLELQEKTNMIKTRLEELEREISLFKENNAQLMKAKQEHELLISQHAQEQLEAAERLKDERIQMEIYLHDERMKLEEEKRKFEQQCKMKTQAMASKERKEMEKLREQVAQLEAQLKTKDSNHAAAQARWRTQIRTMEREEKRLHEQIEILTKENKRLENEVLKASRENNNKLLQEINRNIAKLAPKQTQHESISFPNDDQPPILASSKTMLKPASIAANKTSKSPSKKPKRATQTSRTIGKRGQQQNPSFPETPSSDENDSNPETSFPKQTTKTKVQQEQSTRPYLNYAHGEEDEEDDILKELQTTTAKANKTSAAESKLHKNENKIGNTTTEGGSADDNMKREILNADGSKDIWYPNGNLKKISADGMLIRMLYYNKDIKETNINEGTVKYYYHETNTWHTTYLDGLEILEFPNGQIEHRHKNGLVEVHYPNNSVKIMDPRDDKKSEEWRFPDGTHLVQMRNGDKILSLPNGQKEIHTKLQKRREYPDGTVKIVYPDGSTETRYSNGRVRLKDKEGNLVMDTDEAK